MSKSKITWIAVTLFGTGSTSYCYQQNKMKQQHKHKSNPIVVQTWPWTKSTGQNNINKNIIKIATNNQFFSLNVQYLFISIVLIC
jgi:hypothetical protein